MSRYGAPTFNSLLDKCILWAPLQHSAGVSGDIDEFPILPSGVTVTNNGTFTKTSLGNNKSVLNFDGSTNYISVGNSTNYNLESGNFTICGWVKSTDTTGYNILGIHWGTGDVSYNSFACQINGNYFRFFCINSSNTIIVDLASTTSVVDGNWHFYTIIRNGSIFTFYTNGVAQATGTSATAIRDQYTSSPLRFGIATSSNSVNYYFGGALKDWMIFKGRALTQPEIKLLMNRTHPLTGAGLIDNGRYWRLTS